MASILIIDDEVTITSAFATFFERAGAHVTARAHSGQEGIEVATRMRPDIVLLDLRLPDMTGFDVLARVRDLGAVVIMITAYGDVTLAVQAMQNGAENFLTKPVDLAHLAVVVERGLEKVRLRQLNARMVQRGAGDSRFLLGSSPAMRELADQLVLLASSDRTTVLLIGESGSGKGRVADFIHRQSPRSAHPFVEVNCAALTSTFLDSELFGHERGAFSEAREPKSGLFEVASGGTLFLDEIGDLDAHLQPKLLRVLEGKSFRRLGGTTEISANVRLIAATNKDLVNQVTAGTFREDLYYRLSVMPVHLPPLRARSREDLVELMGHLLEELAGPLTDAPRTITDGALEKLLRYNWPGNIRELRNVLERAMIMGRGQPAIDLPLLPAEVRDASGRGVEHHVPRSLAEVERAHIERTLQAREGNRTHAARELEISRATLIKKIKSFGLSIRTR